MRASRASFLALSLFALPLSLSAHEEELQKILASDGLAGDSFGAAVDVNDETIVVAAPDASTGIGAVYVFVHDGEEWTEEQKLTASDGVPGDLFGHSVSVVGDRVLIGAPGHDAGGADAGAAYVFLRTAGVWAEEAKLTPTGALAGDRAGGAVSLSDDTAVLGAPQSGAGGSSTGKAIVFRRTGTSWAEEATLTALDGAPDYRFGDALSLAGDLVLIGAPHSTGAAVESGAVYGFTRTGTVWTASAKFFPADGASDDHFGESVSLFQGLTVAVGAPGHDSNGSESGAVYKFFKTPTIWTQVRKFTGVPGDEYGSAVSQNYRTTLSGITLGDAEVPDAGAANIYVDLPTKVGFDIFVASDATTGDGLGTSIAHDVCWIVTGAPGNDALGAESGAAYIYPMTHSIVTPIAGSSVNPAILATVDPAVMGETWTIDIDATTVVGAASTTVFGTQQPLTPPAMLGIGELLIDPASGVVFILNAAGSGLNTHSVAVPNNPWLLGIDVSIQGAVRDVTSAILTLTNAETARIGCPEDDHHTP